VQLEKCTIVLKTAKLLFYQAEYLVSGLQVCLARHDSTREARRLEEEEEAELARRGQQDGASNARDS